MYLHAKQYFINLALRGSEASQNLLNEYDNLCEEHGEFLGARFIRDVYLEFQQHTKENTNG